MAIIKRKNHLFVTNPKMALTSKAKQKWGRSYTKEQTVKTSTFLKALFALRTNVAILKTTLPLSQFTTLI